MAIGIGIGLPFRRGQSGYPRAGLTGRYVQLTEGGNLINTLGGTSIPYVSGSGLDQIFDFSVLNDDRFDKGSYVGNAYSLPEYYNFPYVGIYYDATSEATRYHWKLTDFHYANLEDQSVNLTNWAFLEAKATTDTSNIITSVQSLLIYSSDYTEATCYSSGTIYKANTKAYGLVLDCTINKVGSQLIIQFINNSNNDYYTSTGYLISLFDNRLSLYINASGTLASRFRTIQGYLLNNTDYRILVWRNQTGNQYVTGGVGTFAVYIQGKNKAITETVYTAPNLAEMELVNVTGGSGSNPVTDNTYTTSVYKVADLYAGDKLSIAGETFDTWTQGTGKYAHYNNGEQTGVNLSKLRNYCNLYLYLTVWTYKA